MLLVLANRAGTVELPDPKPPTSIPWPGPGSGAILADCHGVMEWWGPFPILKRWSALGVTGAGLSGQTIDGYAWQLPPWADSVRFRYRARGFLPRAQVRLAYADPPYPGCEHRYPENKAVDHRQLIEKLEAYDGWALSTSSTALRDILPLCPAGVRIMAWVKPFAAFKKNVCPAYAWEPIVVKPARKPLMDMVARDWISEPITMKKGLVGAKPERFCFWLFEMLGARPEDRFDDLFPGTFAASKAWQKWRSKQHDFSLEQCELDLG